MEENADEFNKKLSKVATEIALEVYGVKQFKKEKRDWITMIRPNMLIERDDCIRTCKRFIDYKKIAKSAKDPKLLRLKKIYRAAQRKEKVALRREADIFFKDKCELLQECINIHQSKDY
jgi:hypothetical protein